MPIRLIVIFLLISSTGAYAELFESDHMTVPPVYARHMMDAQLHPIAPDQVTAYVEALPPPLVFDMFAGDNAILERLHPPKGGALVVASGYPIEVARETLFVPVGTEDGWTVHLGAISSTDAQSLRLQVRLDGLTDGDQLWYIDPEAPRAFGPYGRDDDDPDGMWLPTIEGDTAALMIRSIHDTLPEIEVTAISHFFRSLRETIEPRSMLPCHINAACLEDERLQTVSTGVGYIVSTNINYESFICTGTLINTPETAELKPYFITAQHCVGTEREARQMDVIWDYRASSCESNTAPALATLPRSYGARLLNSSSSLDMSLLELSNVPPGAHGRTYVGYTTRTPVVGEYVATLHHSKGSHLRGAAGVIQTTNVSSFPWQGQVRSRWTHGVTESGASGAGLFLADSDYRLAGALSNGPSHSCTNPSGNTDNFASFARFYAQAEDWLKGNSHEPARTPCPADAAFNGNPATLASLRNYRDDRLQPTVWGRLVIRFYYRAAPPLTTLVERSSTARDLFRTLAMPFALSAD